MIRIFQILNFLILISIWAYSGLYFSQLPEIFPTHFGLDGKADGFGSRNMIWFLASINTFLFLFLNYVAINPDSPLLNVPDSLRENKNLTELFVNSILLIVLSMGALITYESVQVALGTQHEISSLFLILLLIMFLNMIVFFVVARKKSKKTTMPND